MAIFKINTNTDQFTELNFFNFKSEGQGKISPQDLIARHPGMILSLPELEIQSQGAPLVVRELTTSRGPIDVVIITENADIIIIETKLFRNPESHRTVVAQVIDYVKSFTEVEVDNLKLAFLKSKYIDSGVTDKLFSQDLFCSALYKNIKAGNFKVLIIGDKIHPNILGMVESVHSAPHLAFTIFMVELWPVHLDENNILIQPTIVANTYEVERSVIKLEIDFKNEKYIVESTTPDKEGKGSRPVLTDEQYINSLSDPDLAEAILSFWKNWKALGGDVRLGTVGFTVGLRFGNKRIPIQYVYNNRLALVSQSYLKGYNVPDNVFNGYKENLRINAPKAFDHLVSDHIAMNFDSLTIDEVNHIFMATIGIAKDIKKQ